MPAETLLIKLKQLERPITETSRTSLLSDLRAHQVPDMDGRRTAKWKRGNIYFHSLQDLLLAHFEVHNNPGHDNKRLKESQACFVKDLDLYLAGFPQEEESMRRIFESVFSVGTSAYWHEDPNLVKELYSVYLALDFEGIRPWVRLE